MFRLPDTVILTLHYISREFARETFLVSVRRPISSLGDQFRTDAKLDGNFAQNGGLLWVEPADVPYLFNPGMGGHQHQRSFCYTGSPCLDGLMWRRPESVGSVFIWGTDNKANESLSEKRSTTKWPLMGINMQLSSSLSRSRLSLGEESLTSHLGSLAWELEPHLLH